MNGIEKPVAKYVNHVFENVSFADYISMLEKTPNQAIQNHEIYAAYRKKLKAKTEKEFWSLVLNREADKILYFIIALNQKVVLVKSGEKEIEKRFLGYEFSSRRNSEGMHAMQRDKTVDECTQMYDAKQFDNPEKASTYILKAFTNVDFVIDPKMQNHISHHNLVDMMNFERVDFEKEILLSVKKKVKIESKWSLTNIGNVLFEQPQSKIQVGTAKNIENGIYNFYTSGEKVFKFDEFLVDGENIYLSTGGNAVVKFYDGKAAYSTDTFVIKSNDESKIKTKVIFYFLESIISIINEFYFKGLGLKHLQKPDFRNIQIPLPPLNIQQKIVVEIEVLEAKEKKAKEEVDQLKIEASSLFNFDGEMVKLQDITTKIGSGATPRGGESAYKESGITLIRSMNIYDNEFYPKGLAFIDDEQAGKLNNVTIEENDILFNITGASVCRCCIVENKYLPARVNQHVSIIRINKKALPKFVQQLLISSKLKSELLQLADNSSTREAITKLQLEDFKIPLPPLSEQLKIVAEIEKIEEKIKALETEIAAIPKEKEAVLNKYL